MFHAASIAGVMPLGARASMASQIAQNALATIIWEANSDSGYGLAAWACKTGLGYAVAVLWLCGGYAAGQDRKRLFTPPPTRTRTSAARPRNPKLVLYMNALPILLVCLPLRDPKIFDRANTPPRVLDYHLPEPFPS